jgi:RNA polymerase sigma-70 factor (ECF subfamily)
MAWSAPCHTSTIYLVIGSGATTEDTIMNMVGRPDDDASDSFDPLRPKLIRVAYRMLGSVADAEDVVQEAFLRWFDADRKAVRAPEAFLRRVVTRLCLDHLKSARHRRETYVGPWLPEPILPDDVRALSTEAPDRKAELASDLSLALLHVLERLSPEERAAFILHDAFDCDYPEIASTLGKTEVACRKLVSRARERVRTDRPRFEVSDDQHRDLLMRFTQAIASRDRAQLAALLAPDAIAYTDGGGRVAAALLPIYGADKITRFVLGLARKFHSRLELTAVPMTINGRPGIAMTSSKGIYMVIALETDGARITAIYGIRNPDKLARVASGLSPHRLH